VKFEEAKDPISCGDIGRGERGKNTTPKATNAGDARLSRDYHVWKEFVEATYAAAWLYR
jgi:hypothetical protein